MSLAPTLVLAWGNPSRGDDALGPALVEALQRSPWPGVEFLLDFQLQVEHALDLRDRARVLFVDAATAADWSPEEAFRITRVAPAPSAAITSHALSPQAVLQVFVDIEDTPPPPCWLLAIRGEAWELGMPLSPAAQTRLEAALAWARAFLCTPP